MAASSEPDRIARRALSWPALVLLFFVPSATWALSGPLMSVPDEPAHTVKAVAVWYGDRAGHDGDDVFGNPTTLVDIPPVWEGVHAVPVCFAFKPAVTADCAPGFPNDLQEPPVTTSAGRYPPLYYTLVGWAGRLLPDSTGLYLMRLVSAALSAGLLAWAVRSLARVVRPPLAVLGVLAAATPMVWFLAGSVNPNGFEITAALALWCHLAAVIRWRERSPEPVPRSLLAGLVVSGTALAFTRSLSPLYLLGILALALTAMTWTTLRSLARERPVAASVGGLVAAAAVAMGLVVRSGHLGSIPGYPLPPGVEPWREVVGMSDIYIRQMIAWFGWQDTQQATLSVYAWLAVVFALVGGGLASARARQNVGLVLTVLATVALPVVLQTPRVAEQGLAWQGRYTLPLAVGIPVLAILSVDRGAADGVARRGAVAGAVVLGIGSLYALWWNLRRYVHGIEGELSILSGPWQPPAGAGLWMAVLGLFTVATVALVAVLPDRPPAVPLPAEPGPVPTEPLTSPRTGLEAP